MCALKGSCFDLDRAPAPLDKNVLMHALYLCIHVCVARLYWLRFVLLLTALYTNQVNQLYLEYIIAVSV